MSPNKIRFGIVGCGVISPLHAENILACPDTELVAVSDVDLDKAKTFAQTYGVSQVYQDYEEMLRDGSVDVVSVCVPSGFHGEVVVRAAQYGKHVLCEKPLEITSPRMTDMITACRRADVRLGVVYQRRAFPVSQAVKQAISDGAFGRLVLCDAQLKYYRDEAYYNSAGWRGTWKFDGGGALMNQGVHGVDLIQWLAGGVKRVFGRAAALVRNIEVEDTAVAVVEYQNGAFGVIEGATSVYPERLTRFELHGERGTVIFDDTGIVEWTIRDSNVAAPSVNNQDFNGHYAFVQDMAAAILEHRDPMVSGEEARKAVDIIHAIYESANTGKEIVL
ncbi:Gfo/Idh/MocA family protein [Alicyclobacillus dauci]|uniref:Gfo/Idh/MocA family oxidoreductase n=1 Tax=Alicyclobacillus dauci TaxID=1475485 RepID=A0ABY6YZ87_9BACL|nr:Gfo/Idh/MocA family oxidoreductase [Alicyclobacillus dauci]WAH35583.1 Gfo/Idh/MocA family oxidoreductase [Alicyclobacillus dauci]